MMEQFFKEYDLVIGLEIHVELNTKTKLLCACKNEFGSEPNTNCCPVCLAYPNTKPSLNQAAVEKTIKAGLALGCQINDLAVWERKCYFYPDMPAGFQTSQTLKPICLNGSVTLKSGKHIRIKQIHLEEDAGKLIHDEASRQSYIDFNRAGVPLIEIVTKADITSASEAVEFLEEVRSRLMFAGVADCKMEQGGMRCDVNLSIVKKGAGGFGTRTETKNLNSFKSVAAAIEFEALRHAQALKENTPILLETRKWDELEGKTIAMRLKESAPCIPCPDLPAVKMSHEDIAHIQSSMPLLAYQLKEKFLHEFGLPEYDVGVLTKSKEVAFYFVECVSHFAQPKKISNWLMVDLFKLMKQSEQDDFPISSKHFTQIIQMVEEKLFNKTIGLQLLEEAIQTKTEPRVLAEQMQLMQTVSTAQIEELLKQLSDSSPQVIDDYRQNKEKVHKFLIGHVMKHTKGKAKTEEIERVIAALFD